MWLVSGELNHDCNIVSAPLLPLNEYWYEYVMFMEGEKENYHIKIIAGLGMVRCVI
jgi:hypothetical protein